MRATSTAALVLGLLALAAPEMFVLAATCVVLLVDLFLTERTRRFRSWTDAT